MTLAQGDAFVVGDIFSFQQAERIRSNWRAAAAVSNPQAGSLWSKTTNDKLYHKGAAAYIELYSGVTDMYKWKKGGDKASASALDISDLDGNYFDVTGVTPITSITASGRTGTIICLHFDGILVLTHHATNLVLPSGANITTAAGDETIFIEYDTGKWRCICYTKADGTPIVGGGGAAAFTDLTDTPANYAGAGSKFVKVNATPDGLEFIAESAIDHGGIGGLSVAGDHNWAPIMTTGAWSKSIGAGGDYADWTTMIAAMPDMIAHAVTVTIKTGTVLTELCELKNKHGLTPTAEIIIQAEEYFPRAAVSLTATGGGADFLDDTGAFVGEDFSNCWLMIVHDNSGGTATENGYCQIDSNTNDRLTLKANFPVANAAVNDRYIIVGAIVDAEATRDFGFDISDNTCPVIFHGIGVDDATLYGFFSQNCFRIEFYESGAFECDYAGFIGRYNHAFTVRYCGPVKNNTDSVTPGGGVVSQSSLMSTIRQNGISDNLGYGINLYQGGFAYLKDNIGDSNGVWGAYPLQCAFIRFVGTECSGSSGNHSDPGTAGNANADQAAGF